MSTHAAFFHARAPATVPRKWCLTNCRPARANRRETRRDGAHRRSAVCTLPIPPAATHRHRAPDATPTSTRAALFVPQSCRTNASRANAAATEPTDDPVHGAHHTARRHAPSPRPDSTRLFVPPSCLMNASRANAARANRRETRRDAAHRRSAVCTLPIPPAATHRHRAPDATPTSTRAALFVPQSCRTNASRANAARAAS